MAPALVGLPLADAGRGALAMGLDLILLALLAFQEARTDWAERDDESAAPAVQIAADTAAVISAAPVASGPAASAQVRIHELEAALADARKPVALRRQFNQRLESVGATLGWGIVYFSRLARAAPAALRAA